MAATRMEHNRLRGGRHDFRQCPVGGVVCPETSDVTFENSDVVRSAVRMEGFRDDEFNYQLIRAMGVAEYGGSSIGECLSVAAEITDGSPRSWSHAFEQLAVRVERRGRACLARDHSVSGRDHLLRASTYYRMAAYYTDSQSEASLRTGSRSQTCFIDATALFERPIEPMSIPYSGGFMPGYLVRPSPDAGTDRDGGFPTLIAVGGFDSSAEELYFHLGAPGAGRGWNVVVFDGPGQPGCMSADPTMSFRPDYEVPLAAVIDAVGARSDVDPGRMALAGLSFGSYFASRSAATDSRVKALVASPPVVDMRRYIEAWAGPETFQMKRDIRPEDVIGVPEDLMPRQTQWGITATCFRFGVPSYHAFRDVLELYRLGEMASAITCPALALIGDREGKEPLAQFDSFVADVAGPVTSVLFGPEDGSSTHTQSDNLRLSAQVTFDWLDEQFQVVGIAPSTT
jgi:pimeloyl-ACP methyl ester carboxylesterase